VAEKKARIRPGRRWVILAIGVIAQAAASAFIYGVPFLVPTLRDTLGLSLAQVGVYVAAPTVGLLCTLIAWGAAADRWGERVVMASGLAVAGLDIAALVAVTHRAPHPPTPLLLALLVVGGAGGASVNAASGRMVMGWFPPTERGMAMGIRQTAQPLGVGLAGLSLPTLAHHLGAFPAMVAPGGLCLLSAVGVTAFAPDPPRAPRRPGEARPRSPYRSWLLPRVHAASALLVVPQFAVSAFTVEYLVHQRHWGTAAAGAFAAAMQLAGAAGRIGSGAWSDRVGSRLRPMRQLAVAAGVRPRRRVDGALVGLGGTRRTGRRRGRLGGRQRARLHRHRRDRRSFLVGARARYTEHRTERVCRIGPCHPWLDHRRVRVRGRLRGRGDRPADRDRRHPGAHRATTSLVSLGTAQAAQEPVDTSWLSCGAALSIGMICWAVST
jgi:nitrate/nitrite transporter NarK